MDRPDTAGRFSARRLAKKSRFVILTEGGEAHLVLGRTGDRLQFITVARRGQDDTEGRAPLRVVGSGTIQAADVVEMHEQGGAELTQSWNAVLDHTATP